MDIDKIKKGSLLVAELETLQKQYCELSEVEDLSRLDILNLMTVLQEDKPFIETIKKMGLDKMKVLIDVKEKQIKEL